MAVTRISELTPIASITVDDIFIINDGDVTTNSITYGNLLARVTTDIQGTSLTFTDSVELSGSVTLSGNITVSGDINFTGDVGGILLNDLVDVNTVAIQPLDGQNLVWIDSANRWEPRTTVIPPNTVVDSINGQIGTVVLTTDDIDDSVAAHKFATSVQLGLADTSLQPTDNVSELTNDANYVATGDNISLLNNDAGYLTAVTSPVDSVNGETGVVVLDADHIDDTSTDHKFATSVQLGLAETAVQPTNSVNALADVDTVTAAPVDGQVLQWNDTNSEWVPGNIGRTEWEVDGNGTTAWNFTGVGFDGTEDNPTIYVIRGQKYRFNSVNGSHPFRIQSTSGLGGTLYNDGVTNNGAASGTVEWEVQMDSPDPLYYQCGNHSAMGGDIRVLDIASSAAATASNFTFDASIIPDTNSAYDLGSAEFKVRHLYLSNNSIKFESGDLNVAAGNLAWQGEPILPTTIANLLTVLGVESYLDNGAALAGSLIPGDIYYNTTDSKLKSVTA